MALRSKLFAGDKKLEACATEDSGHVALNAVGDHVAKIQTALFLVDRLSVASSELQGKLYGPSTAATVLTYKRKRSIINHAYQSQPDDIVGKMTIAALDKDVLAKEAALAHPDKRRVAREV